MILSGDAGQSVKEAGVGQLVPHTGRPTPQRACAVEKQAAGQQGTGRQAGADQELAASQAVMGEAGRLHVRLADWRLTPPSSVL